MWVLFHSSVSALAKMSVDFSSFLGISRNNLVQGCQKKKKPSYIMWTLLYHSLHISANPYWLLKIYQYLSSWVCFLAYMSFIVLCPKYTYAQYLFLFCFVLFFLPGVIQSSSSNFSVQNTVVLLAQFSEGLKKSCSWSLSSFFFLGLSLGMNFVLALCIFETKQGLDYYYYIPSSFFYDF
jgi:hypothetical protein